MDACGFDCLARSYRALEFILAGSMMQRARTAHLASLAGPVGRVLMLGEGPGRLLERVLQDFPSAMVTVVDQSAVMLRQAKQRFASFPEVLDRVEWIQVDLRHWVFPVHRYDLVSTPFFLDCFRQEELETLVPQITRSLKPGAYWLLADFQIPANPAWQRWRATLLHHAMYAFFRRVTGLSASHWVDPDILLTRARMKRTRRQLFGAGLIRSDCWVRDGR